MNGIRPLAMDFSGVYREQKFCQGPEFDWIDCTQVRGTNCYLDSEAKAKIRRLIATKRTDDIHFIDSGNYHYLTRLWTDKLSVPFNLIVFDHHSDMQPPAFQEILSCGSWIKSILDKNSFVRQVFLFGIGDHHIPNIGSKYKPQLLLYRESECAENDFADKFTFPDEFAEYPAYLSIDKDVLSERDAQTNWDAGSLSLGSLQKLLQKAMQKTDILGADVCGEAAPNLHDPKFHRRQALNSRANGEILKSLSPLFLE